eukprot:1756185-Rhodomonas_salina.1
MLTLNAACRNGVTRKLHITSRHQRQRSHPDTDAPRAHGKTPYSTGHPLLVLLSQDASRHVSLPTALTTTAIPTLQHNTPQPGSLRPLA